MRINKYIAQATGLSRRAADLAIQTGRVTINGQSASPGDQVGATDTVTLDNRRITPAVNTLTLMLNKPVGYVCSRNGQGSPTIYELLPSEFRQLKPVGRLDKDSSGLLLLTNDGQLANQLMHPSYQKTKIYKITLHKPLAKTDQSTIESGVLLADGPSKLGLKSLAADGRYWQINMQEGRNRQIRRTFAAMGYTVTQLHRTQFGDYRLKGLTSGAFKES